MRRLNYLISMMVCLLLLMMNPIHAHGGKHVEFDYLNQDESFWKSHLSGETLQVCRFNATEAANTNKYANLTEKGIYYCACCGGDFPLFSSETKFISDSGWPSFTEALKGAVIQREDPHEFFRGLVGLAPTEVLCARCHSHLGHVFDDGPKPSGLRYCMNSAALRFVPVGEEVKRTYEVNLAP